jgi:hypothetical protein
MRAHRLLLSAFALAAIWLGGSAMAVAAGEGDAASQALPGEVPLVGTVYTRGTRDPVADARVEVGGESAPETTDAAGRFRFAGVPPGDHVLTVSAAGYKTARFVVHAAAGAPDAKLYLPTGAPALAEVVVRERRETANVSDQTLEKKEVFSLPGAQNDPVRAAANLPGVAHTFPLFNTGGLVIRGVSGEDSGYYLNGRRLPLLFHFATLTYLFNSELIDTVNFLPGGYDVRYGNALGGIVEVTARPPRKDRLAGVVDLSNYTSFALLEGPLAKNVAVAGAVRRSFMDLYLPYVIPKDQARLTVAPAFWDYQLLLEARPSAPHRLSATVLGALDDVGLINEGSGGETLNVTGAIAYRFHFHRQDLEWTWEPATRFRNLVSLSNLYSLTRLKLGPDNFLATEEWSPILRDEWTMQLPRNRLTAGVSLNPDWIKVDLDIVRPTKEGDPVPASFSADPTFRAREDATTLLGAAYVQDEIDAGKYVRITPGARAEYMAYNGTWFVDPRLFVRVTPAPKWTIKAGVGQYHQFPKSDEYVRGFGNPDLDPENSLQANLGIGTDLPYGLLVDVQGFYKRLDHLIARAEAGADVPYRNTGVGYVYGGEVLVRKKLTDFWLGWVAYSYSVSRRKDAGSRPWRDFDGDQRHNVLVVSTFGLPQGVRLGFRFQYATGTPYTEIEYAVYDADGDRYVPVPSSRINGARNPDLHQLDIRFDKVFTYKTWELSTYVDVQNVYLQPQPLGYAYNYDYTQRRMLVFPAILPSFGITARF